MYLKKRTQSPSRPSQLPESRAKTMSKTKPLNPDADPFHIPLPTAKPDCSSRPMLSRPICGGQLERGGTEIHALPPPGSSPADMVSQQEARFPLVYSQEHQLVLLPEPTLPQAGFPGYHSGYWYAQPLAAYQPCTFWSSTPILQPHPVDNHGIHMYWLVNEETLEPIYGSNFGAEDKQMVNFSKMILEERNRCQQNLPMGYGRKRMLVEKDEAERRAKGANGRPAEESTGGCAVRRPIVPFPPTMEEAENSVTTTVMIRNIPNQYQFKDLLLILDDHCWELNKTADPAVWSKFDFVYLPMDYRKHAKKGRISNLGYAFVNFTTASAAFKFYQQCQGLVWNGTVNRKTCEITTAQFQGKEALMRIFSEKVFRCESHEFLPVVFSDARDGFNRGTEGTFLGKYVRGLPRKSLAS